MLFLKTFVLSGLLVGAALVYAPAAQADEARDTYQRCVSHVNSVRNRAVRANERTAERTVRAVRELLREGKEREARRAAHNGVHRIERQSAAAVKNIENTCRQCIRKLKELGANELAERLAVVCRESIAQVEQSKHRAIAAIRNAFD